MANACTCIASFFRKITPNRDDAFKTFAACATATLYSMLVLSMVTEMGSNNICDLNSDHDTDKTAPICWGYVNSTITNEEFKPLAKIAAETKGIMYGVGIPMILLVNCGLLFIGMGLLSLCKYRSSTGDERRNLASNANVGGGGTFGPQSL